MRARRDDPHMMPSSWTASLENEARLRVPEPLREYIRLEGTESLTLSDIRGAARQRVRLRRLTRASAGLIDFLRRLMSGPESGAISRGESKPRTRTV
jgi:hypothetical protein